jgi:hypothetical protein
MKCIRFIVKNRRAKRNAEQVAAKVLSTQTFHILGLGRDKTKQPLVRLAQKLASEYLYMPDWLRVTDVLNDGIKLQYCYSFDGRQYYEA